MPSVVVIGGRRQVYSKALRSRDLGSDPAPNVDPEAEKKQPVNDQDVSATGPTIAVATEARLPTKYGTFISRVCVDSETDAHHVALVMGDVADGKPVLMRIHSECLTGDAFGSLRCDCGQQLDQSLRQIAEEKRGILLYLRQEGRGIGLFNKIRAYALQDDGLDTVQANEHLGFPADGRDYRIAAHMLLALGARRLRLLTNNPKKLEALAGFGLEVVERVPLVIEPSAENEAYLQTKRRKLGHMLTPALTGSGDD